MAAFFGPIWKIHASAWLIPDVSLSLRLPHTAYAQSRRHEGDAQNRYSCYRVPQSAD
ncbi:hypothetical protein ABIC78_001458 [Novosphingobium sp. 1529]|uniref:hypothetical protein n=1 Tax=Novosphingobium sp. 1529 TaxID=3156424 RepID=UPI001441EA87